MTSTIGAAAAPATSSLPGVGAAAPPVVVEQIVCVPLGTKLTRSTCASRHRRAAMERAGKTPKGTTRLVDGHCHSCEVGAAHARDETPTTWPSGAPLELVQLRVPSGLAVVATERGWAHEEPGRGAAARAAEEGGRMAKARGELYALDGVEQGIAAWSRDARCVVEGSVLGARLRMGWPVLAALTLPKGSARPAEADAPPPTRSENRKTPKKKAKKKAELAADPLEPILAAHPGAAVSASGIDALLDEEIARLERELVAARAYRAARAGVALAGTAD